ncbi:protein HASTY 1 isoform X5 [Triticum aestivum]|uniref:protein HASTY 1 isoform X5 n=1 Tax=Triticum aestivum TaxID=4565 RepID=UPI001D00BDD5|nr:protein HASTY 1-like isoform X5 [Triticum aestivum]
MDASCLPTEAATGADRDSDPPNSGQVRTEEELYVESFLKVSLLLANQELIKVQLHGYKMLQHLLKYRSEKLSSANLLKLMLQLVKSDHDLVLESTDSRSSMPDKRPQNSDWSAAPTGINETISSHQGMDCPILAEHNLLCEAFIIATSCLGIQQYMGMLLCLLNSLNRIWIQMEWNCKYVRTMSGLSNLFSDGQFLKMSYHVVKFCEEKLMNGINEYGACDVFSTALLELIIPLFLWLLRCIHVLWTAEIGVDLLPAEVEKAKTLSCMELDHLLEISDGLYTIDSEESFRENETRALLEGTRQRVYNFIGLCTTIKGAFPKLLESLSVGNAFTEALGCMELRHLGKLIRLVVIPLVKHCPREILEEWTVNLLEPILLECEDRLHGTWFYLLYKRQAHNLFNYGNLVGEDEQINKMGYKLLLEFTRKMSDLLEALAFMEKLLCLYMKMLNLSATRTLSLLKIWTLWHHLLSAACSFHK